MTRAIRFAVLACLATSLCSLALSAQGQNAQQPARASVYGPPVGAAAAPRQGTGNAPPVNAQPANAPQQQVQPAGGLQPIRQPGAGAGAGGPNAGGPGGIQVPNGLNIPKAALVPPAPLQPEWYPLDPKVQQWVDSVLTFWEQRSDQVKTLECTFQKWEYDPSYMPNELVRLQSANQLHLLPFAKYAEGQIKYAAPDKGLFHVKKLQVYAQGKPGEKAQYTSQPAENGEHWVTDGKRVFAFDAIRKEVIESQLPPEMQGKSLADGPLPFMFGAKAESIKARYWIRPLQAEAKGEYCLEAIPKGRQDAANFKSVQIVLDEEVYLPTKMQIFEADYSPANPHRTAYKFDKREVNSKSVLGAIANPLNLQLNPWHSEFYEVKTPSGWRRVVRDASGNVVGPGSSSTAFGPPVAPQPAQATRPVQALPTQR